MQETNCTAYLPRTYVRAQLINFVRILSYQKSARSLKSAAEILEMEDILVQEMTRVEYYGIQDTQKPISCRRTPRKSREPQRTPIRSSNSRSSVVLHFELVNESSTPTLKISASTNAPLVLKARRRLFGRGCSWISPCSRATTDSNAESSDEADHDQQEAMSTDVINTERKNKSCKPAVKVKTCASCKTKKTPLWRDAEDGTPYCNACGIRFKKYRICCPVCSYIPRKDEKLGNTCCQCGSKLLQYKLR